MSKQDAESIALEVLNSLVSDSERLGQFLAASGLDPATIRTAASGPGFLAAILDHVASDERLLLAIGDETGLGPERIMSAKQLLSPEADWYP
ncbi:DUF3572 domain-containing protein [uncultured Enterovirga sp.]|uniref:DUF3572 domain-containing protein n=1 Tax=uncultured Enterovirga sp. TaxID=2026352 RepID=UPI0035CB656E